MPFFRRASLGLVFLALAACSLPRGAALQSEILSESQEADAPFQLVEVTRASTEALSRWPATGWNGHYRWLQHTRAPEASLIQSGDSVTLFIWDSQPNSLLTTQAAKLVNLPPMQVSPSGTIFVPYVGEVLVRGLTRDAARKAVTKEVIAVVPDAQVQLSVEAGRRNTVDLVAGVASPGSYPLETRNTPILTLIAQGGGISPGLRHPLVRLQRGGQSYAVRAEALLSDPSRNVILRGGDQVLVVEDDRYFTALGATGAERLIHFEKETLSALDAMSVIGGLNDARANPQGVLILRDYPAKAVRADGSGPGSPQVIFAIDLTSADGLFAARAFDINPGDTVLATESPVTAAQTVMSLIGSAFGLGRAIGN